MISVMRIDLISQTGWVKFEPEAELQPFAMLQSRPHCPEKVRK